MRRIALFCVAALHILHYTTLQRLNRAAGTAMEYTFQRGLKESVSQLRVDLL